MSARILLFIVLRMHWSLVDVIGDEDLQRLVLEEVPGAPVSVGCAESNTAAPAECLAASLPR